MGPRPVRHRHTQHGRPRVGPEGARDATASARDRCGTGDVPVALPLALGASRQAAWLDEGRLALAGGRGGSAPARRRRRELRRTIAICGHGCTWGSLPAPPLGPRYACPDEYTLGGGRGGSACRRSLSSYVVICRLSAPLFGALLAWRIACPCCVQVSPRSRRRRGARAAAACPRLPCHGWPLLWWPAGRAWQLGRPHHSHPWHAAEADARRAAGRARAGGRAESGRWRRCALGPAIP